MMYHNKVVAVVKHNGKVLREQNGEVTIPFGSEYSVLVKNLNSVRIMFQLGIDSDKATGDRWIIVQPNSEVEVERYIRNDNLESGNRFKFIERTGEIEEVRGVKAEDGLIRVEFKTEKRRPIVTHNYHYDHYYHGGCWHYHWPYYQGILTGGLQSSGVVTRALAGVNLTKSADSQVNCSTADYQAQCYQANQNTQQAEQNLNDVGITVPGSISNQKFENSFGFETEPNSDVIVLHLKGRIGAQPATRPITVDVKAVCSTCRKSNKATAQYCSRCGTSLVLV